MPGFNPKSADGAHPPDPDASRLHAAGTVPPSTRCGPFSSSSMESPRFLPTFSIIAGRIIRVLEDWTPPVSGALPLLSWPPKPVGGSESVRGTGS